MKTHKYRNNLQITSVIGSLVPTPKDGAPLFDDCPICQELKAQMELGEIEEVEIDLDLDLDFGKPN